MLFDLIKCHAALRFLQREGKEIDGEVRIAATRQDFDAAVRLYAAINQEGGGQDSKMTRNEAAALATIARMGWESFTVRMLQEATGLSYHQVRRILQGYTARGMTYCGLLKKCPAISVVDATVIDESTGTTVRRHELHFQFDAGRYQEWVAELAVWLEDEDEGEDDSPPPSSDHLQHLQPCCKGVCKHECKEIEGGSSQLGEGDLMNKEILAEINHGVQGSFATNSRSHSSPDPAPLEEHRDRMHDRGVPCVPGPVANETIEHDDLTVNQKKLNALSGSSVKSVCTPICTPLCNTGATVANYVRPLSGVLDPRTFARVKVELGRCDICDTGKAVYRSREAQTHICEGCYARLVREGNAREGVR